MIPDIRGSEGTHPTQVRAVATRHGYAAIDRVLLEPRVR